MDKKINVKITGNADELGSSAQAAGAHIENLKGHADKTSMSLHQFQGVAKLASRELAHLVHAAASPIGVFAVGIIAIKEALHAQAEAAKEAAERMEQIQEANKRFKEGMEEFRMEKEGKELTQAGHQMKRLEDMKEANEKELKKTGGDEIDTYLSGQLNKHPWLKMFANDNDIRRGELIGQRGQIDEAIDSIKSKPMERHKAVEGGGGGNVFGSSNVSSAPMFGSQGIKALKEIAKNTGGESNPNSHFE